ncbi:hypothetical protein LEP1GSC035_0538 [Leptospira noguchii str. 2007001578]|uniref:Lipoprotein n=1 Tax=Leptospira noguchii str. 2007001578 TaxID=1049974 RepID=A0ABP2T5Y6_9LEPT|nr:hypothetical protein LEP1GSC035_0538 [Leptospira noguchii str. 2007001578]
MCLYLCFIAGMGFKLSILFVCAEIKNLTRCCDVDRFTNAVFLLSLFFTSRSKCLEFLKSR